MATYVLCPLSTFMQVMAGATAGTGVALNDGLIWTYAAGTSTPTPTWTDSTGSVQNSNPIQLNTFGQLANVNIWQKAGTPIKIQFSTNAGTVGSPVFGTQIGPTFDNISGIGDSVSVQATYYGGTDVGSVNAYVLNFPANFTSYTNGLVIYWIPSNSNTSASTINVNGLGIVNITNVDGTPILANQLIANQVAVIVSQGGNFVLTSLSLLSGSFSPSWTGFGGSPPTGTMFWQKNGTQVTLEWAGGNGTSNATSMTIGNIPAGLMPNSKGANLGSYVTLVMDNGAISSGTAIFASLSTLQFNKGTTPPSATGFTNTGLKGLDSGWSLTYLLR